MKEDISFNELAKSLGDKTILNCQSTINKSDEINKKIKIEFFGDEIEKQISVFKRYILDGSNVLDSDMTLSYTIEGSKIFMSEAEFNTAINRISAMINGVFNNSIFSGDEALPTARKKAIDKLGADYKTRLDSLRSELEEKGPSFLEKTFNSLITLFNNVKDLLFDRDKVTRKNQGSENGAFGVKLVDPAADHCLNEEKNKQENNQIPPPPICGIGKIAENLVSAVNSDDITNSFESDSNLYHQKT
jgi:hypothetical protein